MGIVERIVYLFGANKLYLRDAKRKILEIINNNPDSTEEEIIEMIRNIGGTKEIFIFLGIFATILMIFLLGLIYMLMQIPS